MQYYELTYLLNSNIDEPKSSIEDIVETINKRDVELDSKSNVEQIELGSSIKPKLGEKRLEKALMGTVEFHLEASEVNELREELNQKREVLRTMIVKKKEEPVEPEQEQQQEEEDKKVELEDIDQKLDDILEE